MDLPTRIGARVAIPANGLDLKRQIEARGFWPESSDGRHVVMRRDFSDGVLRAKG